MLKVAVTGSIASGKSLFTTYLARRGAAVIDADRIGHEVIRKDGPAYEAVVREFGEGILRPDGEIDRAQLGRVVFGDPAARRRLEAIVHPPLVALLERRVEEAARSGAPMVVVDAALVYEFGIGDRFDAVIAVTSPDPVRKERLRGRGLSDDEADARLRSQMDQEEKARRADYRVDNPGMPEGLEREAERIWNILRGPGTQRGTSSGKEDGK